VNLVQADDTRVFYIVIESNNGTSSLSKIETLNGVFLSDLSRRKVDQNFGLDSVY